MHNDAEISLIVEALTNQQGLHGMTYQELIFYVAFDSDLCNTIVHALDADAISVVHSLLN